MTGFDLSSVAVGGLGLTGRALAEALLARGHHVIVADDQPEAIMEAASKLAIEVVDATSEEQLDEALSKVDLENERSGWSPPSVVMPSSATVESCFFEACLASCLASSCKAALTLVCLTKI